MSQKDKSNAEVMNQNVNQKRQKGQAQTYSLLRYFFIRGQILLKLEQYEKAYISFSKALSFSHGLNITNEIQQSYNKMLLLSHIVHLYDGKSGHSPARTMLELAYLLHFTSQYDQTMQQLKQNCQYYTLFITALQKDTKKKLNPNSTDEEEQPTGVDDGTG